MCEKELTGKQTKFCSKRCCQSTINSKHQDYEAQRLRGKTRRVELIKLNGGCCSKCGYDKNFSALEFHHLDPEIKSFGLDIRKCSNSYWDDLVEESKKCILVCANCHVEIHDIDNAPIAQ